MGVRWVGFRREVERVGGVVKVSTDAISLLHVYKLCRSLKSSRIFLR